MSTMTSSRMRAQRESEGALLVLIVRRAATGIGLQRPHHHAWVLFHNVYAIETTTSEERHFQTVKNQNNQKGAVVPSGSRRVQI